MSSSEENGEAIPRVTEIRFQKKRRQREWLSWYSRIGKCGNNYGVAFYIEKDLRPRVHFKFDRRIEGMQLQPDKMVISYEEEDEVNWKIVKSIQKGQKNFFKKPVSVDFSPILSDTCDFSMICERTGRKPRKASREEQVSLQRLHKFSYFVIISFKL